MYLEHFGFLQPPFNLTPDPGFIYSTRAYQEAFTGLRWGIKLRQGLMVVMGEAGTGKTTLLRLIQNKLESDIHTAVISSCIGDFTALLHQILDQLGRRALETDRRALIERVREYLTEQFDRNHVVAVLIDEAQDLPSTVLKELACLLDMEIDGKPAIQIVLAGPRELETKLDSAELASIKQRIVRWCELAPLAKHEVALYIDCRLARAGCPCKNLFSTEAVGQIAIASNGIPRIINIICDNALLAAYSEGRSEVSLEIVQKVARELRLTAQSEYPSPVSSFATPTPRVSKIEPESLGESVTTAGPLSAESVLTPRRMRRIRDYSGLQIAAIFSLFVLVVSGVLRFSELIEPLLVNPVSDVYRQPVDDWELGGRADSEMSPLIDPGSTRAIQIMPSELSAILDTEASSSKTVAARQSSDAKIGDAQQVGTKVFLHTAEGRDRSILRQIGTALQGEGYVIPDTRISSSPTRGDVRFFFSQDRIAAERVKSIVEAEFRRLGYQLSLELLARDGKKFQFAAPGKIELWIPPLANVLLARVP